MRIFTLLLLICINTIVIAQEQDSSKVFPIIEIAPKFEGGMSGFYAYIAENLRYPQEAIEKGIEGKVMVIFIVNEDGSIDQESVGIFKGVHPLINAEAVRLIKESPKWIPGVSKAGSTAKVKMTLPINFKINTKKRKGKKKKKPKQ